METPLFFRNCWMTFNWLHSTLGLLTWVQLHLLHRDHPGLTILWSDTEMLIHMPSRWDCWRMHHTYHLVPIIPLWSPVWITSISDSHVHLTDDLCINEYRQETVHWQCCETGINYALRQATDLHDLEDIYKVLSQGLMHYFPNDNSSSSPTKSGFAVQKWAHYAKLRQPGTPDLKTLFIRWKHFSLFQKMDRMHTRWIKQIKLTKITQLTQEAQQAFQHHDSFRLFHAVSRACPKQKTKRVHLRNDAGEFMTPPAETAAYVQYIQDNWSGPSMVIPDLPTPGVPFSVTELEQVIATIPTTKAVAPGFAPGPMWKSQASFIAPWLMTQLQHWWTKTPYIPQMWRDAWACWHPKPHKSPTRLENWRMLGLQEPLGKAVLRLIARKALFQTSHWLGTFPQYAYLPFRSKRDCILRGAVHCDAVRQLVASQKRSIHASTQSRAKMWPIKLSWWNL